jgi:glucose-1-phosphate adenylyltransferase
VPAEETVADDVHFSETSPKEKSMMRNVLTMILGGGQGTRLYPLTKHRAKPAVPLGGKYRLIDIPLSNCINSGMERVYVLTQFLSASLHRHLRQTYRFDMFNGGFVELLAAQRTMNNGTDWYQGTADAVRKNLRYLEDPTIEYVLILSGDQLYRMDYREMFATHQRTEADVTIGGLPVSRFQAGSLGVMRVDDSGRVRGFAEKPQTNEEVEPVAMEPAWFQRQGVESEGCDCIANMGIYLFNRDVLVDILTNDDCEDFGKEVFPRSVDRCRTQVHLFDGYWEDIGTIRAFYEANLSLAADPPPFEFGLGDMPVYTRPRFLPPARIRNASISDSLVSDGCEIDRGAEIVGSIIGPGCTIDEGATIRNSILFGVSIRRGTNGELSQLHAAGRPAVWIGAGSAIEGAIVDRNARIGRNVRVVNDCGIQNNDGVDDCVVRDGIPVVAKNAMLPDEWALANISDGAARQVS